MSASPLGQCPPQARAWPLHLARREAANAGCNRLVRTQRPERVCRSRFSVGNSRKVDSRVVDLGAVGWAVESGVGCSPAVEFAAVVGPGRVL